MIGIEEYIRVLEKIGIQKGVELNKTVISHSISIKSFDSESDGLMNPAQAKVSQDIKINDEIENGVIMEINEEKEVKLAEAVKAKPIKSILKKFTILDTRNL